MPQVIEDREMMVQPNQTVITRWIDIDLCKLGNRTRMDVAAVERTYRRYVQAGDCQFWPPLVGHWDDGDDRFVVCDGRHELLALTMLGKEKVFVAWLEDASGEGKFAEIFGSFRGPNARG